MSTNETKVPRLALSSITLDEKDKQAGSAPFKIFISDGFRVHEVYNPDYVSKFFDTLPPKHLQNSDNVKKEKLKRSRGSLEPKCGHTDFPSSGSLEPKCGDSISGTNSDLALTPPCEEKMECEEFQNSANTPSSVLWSGYEDKEKLQDSGRSHKPVCGDSILPLTAPYEEEMDYEEEIQDSVISQGSKRKLSPYADEEEELQDGGDSRSHVTDLVLMGPNGDIVPWDCFNVIIHQNTGDRTIDDSHFENSYNLYRTGKLADPSDIIGFWRWHTLRFLNKVSFIQQEGPFGLLSLDFIVFRDSRLVSVDVKFFLEGKGIVVGPDEKKNNATESSFICGKLSFHNSAYDDAIGVLLKTPEDKGIKVEHGKSIRLLRNKFPVPVCKFFTVEASLKDPVTSSVFKGPVKFAFDSFCEEEKYIVSKKLVGRGAKIVLEVTMLPNDAIALGGV